MVRSMRALALAVLVLPGLALAQQAGEYVPPPAREVPGYSEFLLPCYLVAELELEDGSRVIERVEEKKPEPDGEGAEAAEEEDTGTPLRTFISCSSGPQLQELSLRELSILRNTIFARYGWAGFRKPWLREHFKAQPWFKPNPKFSYRLLSANDKSNAELIATAELSFRQVDLEDMRDRILAEAGKWWGDAPKVEMNGKQQRICDLTPYYNEIEAVGPNEFLEQEVRESKDCKYHERSARRDAREPDYRKLSAEDRIELGLISRAMGSFAVDDGQRGAVETSLDEVLSVKALRQLSLRDLRLLRNTIYARRGRPFQSPLLQRHFSRLAWYKADPAYTDARLTKTDLRNVALIRSVEAEFGGALKDADFEISNPSTVEDKPWEAPWSGA